MQDDLAAHLEQEQQRRRERESEQAQAQQQQQPVRTLASNDDKAHVLADLEAYDSVELRRAAARQQMALAAQQLLHVRGTGWGCVRAAFPVVCCTWVPLLTLTLPPPPRTPSATWQSCASLLSCCMMATNRRVDAPRVTCVCAPITEASAPVQVARLAMLTLLAVFRDVLPGYRIRPPTDKELEMSVSAIEWYRAELRKDPRRGQPHLPTLPPRTHAAHAPRCLKRSSGCETLRASCCGPTSNTYAR